MGMYTALHLGVELKADVPEQVVEVLKFMCAGWKKAEEPDALPNHEFFRTDRWRHLFTMDSYYFHADTHCSFRYDEIAKAWFLTVTSNIKNYDNEIEKFVDWIMPYLQEYEGDFLGYSRYEETEVPTLIYCQKPPAPQPSQTTANDIGDKPQQ